MNEHTFEVGDFAEVTGLTNDTWLNGQYVEIARGMQQEEMPLTDGTTLVADWYGVVLVTDHSASGRLQAKNMIPVDRRSVCIHLFGEEDYPGGRTL